MKTRPNIRFFLRIARSITPETRTADTPGTVYCCLTVKGKEKVFTTGIVTAYGQWDTHAHRVLGRSTASKQANEALVKLTDRLNDLAADLDRQSKVVTAQRVYQLYARNGCKLSLIELFALFIEERKSLVGIELAPKTVVHAQVRYRRLCEFLAEQKLSDLRPEEFTANLADKLLHWLLVGRKFARDSANNVLKAVMQVLTWGVRREHLDKSPLDLYQLKRQAPKGIVYLGVGELANLSTTHLAIPSLERVRDCFVFQCWTGLAYADLAALNVAASAEYHTDKVGSLRRILRITRQKSTVQKGYECVIPLLPEAERVLALYNDKLPVPTNQIYNRYLKQVGELCGVAIEKCTSHVGRKTAGVMMLNAGIRMETVSKFLGHSSVRMTEKVYAKILDTTVVDDFSGLFGGAPAAVPPLVPYELPAPNAAPVVLRPARRVEKGGSGV